MITSSHYSPLFYLTKIGESGLSNSDENHALTKGKEEVTTELAKILNVLQTTLKEDSSSSLTITSDPK